MKVIFKYFFVVNSDVASKCLLVFGWFSTVRAHLLYIQMGLDMCFNRVLVIATLSTDAAHPHGQAFLVISPNHVFHDKVFNI